MFCTQSGCQQLCLSLLCNERGHLIDVSEQSCALLQAVTDRKKLQMKRKAEAVAEQQREDLALAELNAHRPVSATATAASLQPERIAQAA